MTPEIAGYALFYFMLAVAAYGLHVTVKTLFGQHHYEDEP
jgi:hypothetical protein